MPGCVDLSVADGKDRVINVKVVDADEGPAVPSHVVGVVVNVVVVDHHVDGVDRLTFHRDSRQMKKVILE